MAVTLSEAIIIQGASVVFAAGMVWAKLTAIDKRLQDHLKESEDHPAKIARLETEVKNLKHRTQ